MFGEGETRLSRSDVIREINHFFMKQLEVADGTVEMNQLLKKWSFEKRKADQAMDERNISTWDYVLNFRKKYR